MLPADGHQFAAIQKSAFEDLGVSPRQLQYNTAYADGGLVTLITPMATSKMNAPSAGRLGVTEPAEMSLKGHSRPIRQSRLAVHVRSASKAELEAAVVAATLIGHAQITAGATTSAMCVRRRLPWSLSPRYRDIHLAASLSPSFQAKSLACEALQLSLTRFRCPRLPSLASAQANHRELTEEQRCSWVYIA
jgi:hypothetical protein